MAFFPAREFEYSKIAGTHFVDQSCSAKVKTPFFSRIRSISCSNYKIKQHVMKCMTRCGQRTTYGFFNSEYSDKRDQTQTSSAGDRTDDRRPRKVCLESESTISFLGLSLRSSLVSSSILLWRATSSSSVSLLKTKHEMWMKMEKHSISPTWGVTCEN